FFYLCPPPPRSTLFPYTTLFRSQPVRPRELRPLDGAAGLLRLMIFLYYPSTRIPIHFFPGRGYRGHGQVRQQQPLHRLGPRRRRSEEHTSELQSLAYLVCRLLLE